MTAEDTGDKCIGCERHLTLIAHPYKTKLGKVRLVNSSTWKAAGNVARLLRLANHCLHLGKLLEKGVPEAASPEIRAASPILSDLAYRRRDATGSRIPPSLMTRVYPILGRQKTRALG